jgi:hypothetical protein
MESAGIVVRRVDFILPPESPQLLPPANAIAPLGGDNLGTVTGKRLRAI